MRKFTSILILTLLLLANLFASDNEEFRGTWVITWEHHSDSTVIKQILDNHVTANMNAVLYQVRQGGTAYYRSSFEPWGSYAGYEDPGFDPLEFVVKEAHKRGLEVHAWFNTFQTSSTITGTPAAEHPEWVCRDGDNQPMPAHRAISPGLKEVRDYTRDVIMEIVNNYDVDGLHLDYVRWNEYTTSSVLSKNSKPEEAMLDGHISPMQMSILETAASPNRYLYDHEHKYADGVPAGYGSWEEYWRSSVTELVKTVHDSIQTVKPYVRLSVAALGKYRWTGWQGYESVYQDAALWYNENYIDQLTPMNYHWTTGTSFYSMLTGGGTDNWDYWLNDESNVLFSAGPGSYLLEGKLWKNHASIVNESRKVDFVDGFQFFSYGSWDGNLYFEEAGKTIFANKTKIRENAYYGGGIPASPAISLEKAGSMEYNITVTPDASESEKAWYAIYRSEDGTVDVDTDEIIAVTMGNDVFTITEKFDGNQIYAGEYTYAATSLNRFWKESALSNIQTSDAIPSNPPVVLSVTPAEGDSIITNPSIVFEFSKEMDINSFDISVTPEVIVESISISDEWHNLNKEVTIELSALEFGTEYTLTIGSGTMDLAGLAIDGNFDGTGGDSYVISYYTYNVDNRGPFVVASTISSDIDPIDPEEAFTFVFNELLDKESIAENVTLLNSGNNLNVDVMVKDFDNSTVVTMKTKSALLSNSPIDITLTTGITDTAGNSLESDVVVTTNIAGYYYSENNLMDNFKGGSSWWDPEGSGSTVGTVDGFTKFDFNDKVYMPGFTNSESGKITYMWDETYEGQPLLRDHAASGPAVEKEVDSTYTLQCYVFGDGSNNEFRFAMYERNGNDIAEVSTWTTIDWIGWKLVEWDMGDPSQIGEWLGNGIMDGAYYQLDGVHMTRGEGGAVSGEIYIDELRFVKKEVGDQPINHAPVVEGFEDAVTDKGSNLKIKVNFTDQDENDKHEIICLADTSAIRFNIQGHTTGSSVYVIPESEFIGETTITIIVRDFGVGELSDTTMFVLEFSEDVAIDEEIIPNEYSLSQNYPNPFNPTTSIDFSLPVNEKVMINIYDLRGSLVQEVINTEFIAGKYTINIDASNFASGVYIYQMQAGAKVITKKMMLLK